MVRASWRVSSTLPAGGSEESETAWHMFEYIGMTCHENVTFVYWAANKIRSWMGDDQGLVYIHTHMTRVWAMIDCGEYVEQCYRHGKTSRILSYGSLRFS